MANGFLEFPRGSVITFTTGEYSDFSVIAYVKTLKFCDLVHLANKFVSAERAAGNDKCGFGVPPNGFPSWLIANGYVMSCDTTEIHLGDSTGWKSEFGIESG